MAAILCPVLIGRDDELGTLRAMLTGLSSGHGGCVVIQGEAGVGKSRLAFEMTSQARAAGAVVVSGRAVPGAVTIAYRPLTEALLQAWRGAGARPDASALLPWRSMLGPILGAASSTRDSRNTLSPALLGEAVLQVLRLAAGDRAIVVLQEDLHWSDPDTLAVLEYLADNAGSQRVLIVATLRSGTSSEAEGLVERLHARRDAVLVGLDRLTDDQVADMVRACVPDPSAELLSRIGDNADGVPFLVEELLASPGVPRSLADAVRDRLDSLDEHERRTLEFAATLGRHFDWRLLPAAVGTSSTAVARALERGVALQLLSVDGSGFRFRHALTRESVIESMMPPLRAATAARLLSVLDSRSTESFPVDVAASLAEQADDRPRAGELLMASGLTSLRRGALATGADTLRRAAQLLSGAERNRADSAMVRALALAGRVDAALAAGERLLPRLTSGSDRADLQVTLAGALVAAARWTAATERLDAADATGRVDGPADDRSTDPADQVALLRAEIDLATDRFEEARRHAAGVLGSSSAEPELRCHALELVGRSHRTRDLAAARGYFEQALSVARAAELPLATLRATHELGTIEMFDRAGASRLLEARQLADRFGALATRAVLDMHLAAAFMFRFELDAAGKHAESSVTTSSDLALDELRGLGLLFTGQIEALRCRGDDMERQLALAAAVAGDDPNVEGSAWCGGRGMFALLSGDRPGAIRAFGRGVSILRRLPNSGPANYRGVWPLLLAADGDPGAADAIDEARRGGMDVNRANRGLFKYAEAILSGRRGEAERAGELAMSADADLVYYPVWEHIGRMLAAEAALQDRWGEPRKWLAVAKECFDAYGVTAMSRHCERLLGGSATSTAARLGITARECQVLELVAKGLSNKDIADRLYLSPRTVEKHVEALLRKRGARSRTQLIAMSGT